MIQFLLRINIQGVNEMRILIYLVFIRLLMLLFSCISNIFKAHKSCDYPAESKYMGRTLIIMAIITTYIMFLKFVLKI